MIDHSKKTVIFDFGNILINLDFPKCFAAFKEVLNADFSQGLPEKTKQSMFRYEKGELNTEAFLWHLQQFKPEAEIRKVIGAWNAILGELPQSRFDMVEQLRESYNIAMLSNINDMHEQVIHRRVEKEMGIADFHSQYFDKVFYSHHIGYRKPDPACYDYVQKELGIERSEDIFFIDDMEQNITAARAAGWRGIVHNPQEDILNNIEEYLKGF